MTRTGSMFLVLAAATACASGASSSPEPASVPAPATARSAADSGATASASATSRPRRARNASVITSAELADLELASTDAYSAIQRLRPGFLRTRGTVSLGGRGGGILVSVDRGVLVSLETLRSIRVSEVKEIRYLSPGDAAQMFGTKSASAAVIVVTRK